MVETLQTSFSKLWSWIDSWSYNGAYGGFLVHAIHGTINFGYAGPVPSYTYTPLINGFINLYNNTGDKKWLNRANQACEYLFSTLDETYHFANSRFEYAPGKGSDIHTVNPLFSLWNLYKINNDEQIIITSKKILDSTISLFWRGNTFAGPYNMVLTICSALLEYGYITGDYSLFKNYGAPAIEESLQNIIPKNKTKVSETMYRNRNTKDIVYPWYSSVKADCFFNFYQITKNELYLHHARKLIQFTLSSFVPDKGLIHSFILKNGNWHAQNDTHALAPYFFCLNTAVKIGVIKKKEVVRWGLLTLLNNQREIGYFDNSVGYGIRSFIGTTAWNAFAFEFLSNYIKEPPTDVSIPETSVEDNEWGIAENQFRLNLYVAGKTILSVDKRSHRIERYSLPSNYITGRIECSSTCDDVIHIVGIEGRKHKYFGFVDSKNQYFFPRKNIKKNIWIARYRAKIYQYTDKKILVRIKGKKNYEKFAPIVYRIMKPNFMRKFLHLLDII